MTTPVPPEAPGDERGALLNVLAAQRAAFRVALHGLTEEQARSTPSASELSVLGALKHVAEGEAGWLRTMRGDAPDFTDEAAMADWESSFVPGEGDTIASLLAYHAEVAAELEQAVRAVPSLDDTFDLPPAPWDEGGPRSWRWALLHLVEELARHAGHADVVRETIDGQNATMASYEVLAQEA